MSESINSTVPAPAEEPQDWYFTFGYDHTHPVTGESLDRCYVRLHGTIDGTRAQILAVFGNRWCAQYRSVLKADRIDKYGLTEVAMPGALNETITYVPDYDGHWKGHAYLTHHNYGEQVHRTIGDAERWNEQQRLRAAGIPMHGPEDVDPLDQSARAVRGLPVEAIDPDPIRPMNDTVDDGSAVEW